jgi:diguanylate cyclase (GGDEF)-like protein
LNYKERLFRLRLQISDDDSFIESVRKLVETGGEDILTELFLLLTGIAMDKEQAVEHWQALQDHRIRMAGQLDRQVSLTTALSDYVQSVTGLISQPRLIETSVFENIVHESVHDRLTGLFNRPYFDEVFYRQVAVSRRYDEEFAVLFLDVDDFKTVNDTYGHLAGDEALRHIACLITKAKRDSDIAARFGGEEFILLLSHTDNVSAYILAERIRLLVENSPLQYDGRNVKLSVSGGISSYPFNTSDPADLLRMADSAVYLAKGSGKNTICHFKDEKRRYIRVKLNGPVLTQELDFNDAPMFTGISKDICVGGILFENPEPIPLGTLISVQVPMAFGKPVILIGQVVRVETFNEKRYDIGMSTTFKEMEKLLQERVSTILQGEKGSTESSH